MPTVIRSVQERSVKERQSERRSVRLAKIWTALHNDGWPHTEEPRVPGFKYRRPVGQRLSWPRIRIGENSRVSKGSPKECVPTKPQRTRKSVYCHELEFADCPPNSGTPCKRTFRLLPTTSLPFPPFPSTLYPTAAPQLALQTTQPPVKQRAYRARQ